MLGKLAGLAEEVGRPDLRAVFTNAFWRELNEEIGRKLQIEVPRLHSHYKALLWLTLNGGQRSQARVDSLVARQPERNCAKFFYNIAAQESRKPFADLGRV